MANLPKTVDIYSRLTPFAHGKSSNGKHLQKATYADVRAQSGLPAQMLCNVPCQVGSTYQTLWTKGEEEC